MVTVRLLQAAHLRRSHWSMLALGPVKLLGLSKAHGPVSSFCEFTLDFVDPHSCCQSDHSTSNYSNTNTNNTSNSNSNTNNHQKPAARTNHTIATSTTTANNNKPKVVSPIIPNNDNPVWGDTCHFEFPISKGAAPHDGMRIVLNVAVREDATVVEQMLPQLPVRLPGMQQHQHQQHRLLGVGQLDLTELCLGENLISGQPLPGVRDAWMELSLPRNPDDQPDETADDESPAAYDTTTTTTTNNNNAKTLHGTENASDADRKLPAKQTSDRSETNQDTNNNSTNYGKVRVLVSYQPIGLEPQIKDIVAFESFARHSLRTTSCPPILDPLLPLTVLDRRGSYLLVEYCIMAPPSRHGRPRPEKVCARIHRNAVFVIERQNIMDAATNLALLPMDVALSTPIGQATQRAVTPLVLAGRELLMPTILSAKLVWMAARTTGLGVTHGVLALTGTLWHEGTTSLTGGGHSNHSNHHHHQVSGGGVAGGGARAGPNHHNHGRVTQGRRSNATAKFVQL